jgi:DNA-binding response OmpR family regulator
MRVQSLPSGRVDVLIAEDDAHMRFALRRLLEQKGYRCAEAANGRQAVDLALALPPQCVLLDLAIPELDGFSVARQLRSDPRTAGAHIHCVTGLVDAKTRERAHQAGCEQFLTKPLDPSQLLAVVGQQVRRTEMAVVSELTAREAEDLLDWLENQGCTDLEVTLDDKTFTVRCVCPPGIRLTREDDGELHLFRIERGGLAF